MAEFLCEKQAFSVVLSLLENAQEITARWMKCMLTATITLKGVKATEEILRRAEEHRNCSWDRDHYLKATVTIQRAKLFWKCHPKHHLAEAINLLQTALAIAPVSERAGLACCLVDIMIFTECYEEAL